MILYYSPGACSLADHIALHEAGLRFDRVRVDLKTRTTEDGRDFNRINPKGYVPALVFDDGEVLTENVAILSWIADQEGETAPGGRLSRYRRLEMLAFVSTELHKVFKPFFDPAAGAAERKRAAQAIGRRLQLIAERLHDPWLLGDRFTVADAYLFVMLRWARRFGIALPDALSDYFARARDRPAVQRALEEEGLGDEARSAAARPAGREQRPDA
ncbi:MAG: glutathione transferase GstA [Pseudomonadota bacterium]